MVANRTSDPLKLTIVYERAEQGWTTATIPAVPGTISAGRTRKQARENVLDALRLMLATPPETRGTRANVEQVEIRLDLVRSHERGMPVDSPFVVYRDRIVALVGPRRCYFAVDDLDAASFRFVMAMCLCKYEVDDGRLIGPFTSQLAEQWARLILIGPSNVATGLSDAALAEELCVPVDEVTLARAELGRASRSFG